MDITALTENDIKYIRFIVKAAVRGNEEATTGALFGCPLDFTEEEGRIKFKYPAWMLDIKNYLAPFYGEKETQNIMLDLMSELMKPEGFSKLMDEENPINIAAL